jgi:hypothetical protein
MQGSLKKYGILALLKTFSEFLDHLKTNAVEFVSWPVMGRHPIDFRNGYPEAYYDFPAFMLLEWHE